MLQYSCIAFALLNIVKVDLQQSNHGFRILIFMKTLTGICIGIYLLCYSITATAQGNSLLWSISGNGLLHTSYLYGTMHTRDARVFKFADSVLTAFESCENFAMEIIVDDASRFSILQGLYMDTSYTLRKLLSPAQYDSVDQYCRQRTGDGIVTYERLKPIYTAAILSQFMNSNEGLHENEKQYFLDEYFQHLAINQQKKVEALETVGEQLHVFDVMNYEQQAALLMETVRHAGDSVNSFEQMVGYYLDNDLVKMMSYENDFSLPDSLYDGLITIRNHRMADRIDTMIRHHSTFVAVGAGHLGASEGLVNLLRDKGYVVLPVIPTYANHLPNGWYRNTSAKNHFTAVFPTMPQLGIENDSTDRLWHYASFSNAYTTETHQYDLYVANGRQDQLLKKILSHHFASQLITDTVTSDKANNNRFETTLEISDGRTCNLLCFEKKQTVYVLLYTYKRKANKEFRNRFFSSFEILP